MKEYIEIAKKDGSIAGWICLIISVILLVTSFIIPPAGVIDPSVLAGVGELTFWGVIFKLPAMIQTIRDGKSVSIKHGETEVTVSSEKEED